MKNIPSIQQMRAFQTLYEVGSISETARVLHITQPAVTTLIKDLEEKLEVTLFKRTTRKLEKTTAAHTANRYISRVLRELNELYTNLQAEAQNQSHLVKIVSTSTVIQTYVAPLIKQFSDHNSEIKFRLIECSPMEFHNYLKQNDADIAIGSIEENIEGYHNVDLFKDPLVVLGNKNFFKQGLALFQWSDLINYDLVLVQNGFGFRNLINKTLIQLDLMQEVNVVQEVTLVNTSIALAKSGLGITIVPESIAKYFSNEQFIYIPLESPTVSRMISLVYSKSIQTDHFLYHFIDYVKSQL